MILIDIRSFLMVKFTILRRLKNALNSEGVIFNTNSDTEVVLKAYIHFGEDAFSMFNGMFALAIFDNL